MVHSIFFILGWAMSTLLQIRAVQYLAVPTRETALQPTSDSALEEATGSSLAKWLPVDCTNKANATQDVEERVESLEENGIVALHAALSAVGDQTKVSDVQFYARKLQEVLGECVVSGNQTISSRVSAVQQMLKAAALHRNHVEAGIDPSGLYAIGDDADFMPDAGISASEVAQWFMGKVASVDSVTQDAITNNQGLDTAYHLCHRLDMAMEHLLGQRASMKTGSVDSTRAVVVVKALQNHIFRLEKSLREHGFKPGASLLQQETIAPVSKALAATDLPNWVPLDCTNKANATQDVEARVKSLEENGIVALHAALSQVGDQTKVTDAQFYVRKLQEALGECVVSGNQTISSRVSAVQQMLKVALLHRNHIEAGIDPSGLYAISDDADFMPAAGISATEVSGWFMGKVASVDSLAQNAIVSNNGLDDAYHLCHRLDMAMEHLLGQRASMKTGSAESTRAVVVVKALQDHIFSLEKSLREHGFRPGESLLQQRVAAPVSNAGAANSLPTWVPVDCTNKANATLDIEERVNSLEENGIVALHAALSAAGDQTKVTAAQFYARKLQEALGDCVVTGNQTISSRVSEVQQMLKVASLHRNHVEVGTDPSGLYAISDDADFMPDAGISATEVSAWFMGKVASVDSLTQKAITSNEGLDDAYHLCHRLDMAMEHLLAQRASMKTGSAESTRAVVVVKALQDHMFALEKSLREHGFKPGESLLQQEPSAPVSKAATASGLPNWVPLVCANKANATLDIEERVKRLEENGIVALHAALSAAGDQSKVTDAQFYARKLQEALGECVVSGNQTIGSRVSAVQQMLKAASLHRNHVEAGSYQSGVYAINDDADFMPDAGISATEVSGWFMGKVASLDSLTQKAITSNQGLDDAYHLCHRLDMAMEHLITQRASMKTGSAESTRAVVVVRALQDHLFGLEKSLREHGFKPSEVTN